MIEERDGSPNQLEIFELGTTELDYNSELTKNVSDTEVKINPEPPEEKKSKPPPGNVNQYYPGKRDMAYYRFSYRVGTKIKHKHIRGGNVSSAAAQANAQSIRDLIVHRADLQEILSTIASF